MPEHSRTTGFRLLPVLASGLALISLGTDTGEARAQSANPKVTFETSLGRIQIELFTKEAPVTVANFLAYHRSGFYDDTICHRVIPDYVIQCGGFTADLYKKETGPAIPNEAASEIGNLRGTLAMARRNAADSATSQFFFNLKDNDMLNQGGSVVGYAVFGKVIEGMDVVDKIATVPTAPKRGHLHVPVEPVQLEARKPRPAS